MAVSPRNQVLFVVCLLGLVDSFLAAPEPEFTSCVQCAPTEPRCESGNIEPTLCEVPNSYCAVYRVFVGNSQGVYRGCSSRYLRGCRITTLDNQEVTVCYDSCFWDGCNGARNTRDTVL